MISNLNETRDVIAITTALIGALVVTFNWRAARFRGKLKEDLEIQKRYREELHAIGKSQSEIARDEHYKALRNKIHRKMTRAYQLQGTDWSDAALAAICFCILFYAWNNKVFFGKGWQAVIMTVSGVATAILAFLAVRDRGRPRSDHT